jgi:hypothetical protein
MASTNMTAAEHKAALLEAWQEWDWAEWEAWEAERLQEKKELKELEELEQKRERRQKKRHGRRKNGGCGRRLSKGAETTGGGETSGRSPPKSNGGLASRGAQGQKDEASSPNSWRISRQRQESGQEYGLHFKWVSVHLYIIFNFFIKKNPYAWLFL